MRTLRGYEVPHPHGAHVAHQTAARRAGAWPNAAASREDGPFYLDDWSSPDERSGTRRARGLGWNHKTGEHAQAC